MNSINMDFRINQALRGIKWFQANKPEAARPHQYCKDVRNCALCGREFATPSAADSQIHCCRECWEIDNEG